MSWIPTVTGKRFSLTEPDPALIDIRDIAHALSNVCRFTGHTNRFYSVAQHSVHVSQICPPQYALFGLLHDAAEAYTGDVSRPLKRLLGQRLWQIESAIQAAVMHRFGINPDDAAFAAVQFADDRVLATEARDLGLDVEGWSKSLPEPLPERIIPWTTPERAALEFKMRFAALVFPELPASLRSLEKILRQFDFGFRGLPVEGTPV